MHDEGVCLDVPNDYSFDALVCLGFCTVTPGNGRMESVHCFDPLITGLLLQFMARGWIALSSLNISSCST